MPPWQLPSARAARATLRAAHLPGVTTTDASLYRALIALFELSKSLASIAHACADAGARRCARRAMRAAGRLLRALVAQPESAEGIATATKMLDVAQKALVEGTVGQSPGALQILRTWMITYVLLPFYHYFVRMPHAPVAYCAAPCCVLRRAHGGVSPEALDVSTLEALAQCLVSIPACVRSAARVLAYTLQGNTASGLQARTCSRLCAALHAARVMRSARPHDAAVAAALAGACHSWCLSLGNQPPLNSAREPPPAPMCPSVGALATLTLLPPVCDDADEGDLFAAAAAAAGGAHAARAAAEGASLSDRGSASEEDSDDGGGDGERRAPRVRTAHLIDRALWARLVRTADRVRPRRRRRRW